MRYLAVIVVAVVKQPCILGRVGMIGKRPGLIFLGLDLFELCQQYWPLSSCILLAHICLINGSLTITKKFESPIIIIIIIIVVERRCH